ncbi:hypothetical protein ACFT1A_28390 [Rhodococcus sp. NPDC057135]
MQTRVADPRLLRSGHVPLGSFGLLGAAAVGTPPAAVGIFPTIFASTCTI